MHMALFWILGMAAHMGALLLYLMIASIVLISVHSLLNKEAASKTEMQVNRGVFGCIWCIDTKICCSGWKRGLSWCDTFNSMAAQCCWPASCIWGSYRGQCSLVGKLQRTLNAERRRELTRIKKFLKIKTTKVYQCRTTGRTKCAGVPVLVGFQ